MRGQMEKLQSEQVHLQTYRDQLNALLEKIEAIREEKKDGKEPSALELIESVIQAQEAERQRLSRKMHDGPAQALSNFILQAEIAQRLFDRDVDQAREELEVLKDTASATFQKVRDFIFELRPMMLDDLGLVPTLRHYVEAYQEQIDLEIEFTATGTERRLERYLEVMIFRAIQELLSNASRHSQATQIRVQLDTTEQNVKATVEDNGQGFDVDRALEGSMGIKVIKDRVEMLGGHITIDAAEDQGTRISFEIPAAMVGGDVFA
jgi:two-component system sensor histidine kinase DegS